MRGFRDKAGVLVFVRGGFEIEKKRLVAGDSASACSKAIDETLRS